MAAESDFVLKEAGRISVHDSLQIEPGRWWDIGDVSPSPEGSGGREMIRIELLPSEDGVCVLTVPATMPLPTMPAVVGK
jgi:hypothetical protein